MPLHTFGSVHTFTRVSLFVVGKLQGSPSAERLVMSHRLLRSTRLMRVTWCCHNRIHWYGARSRGVTLACVITGGHAHTRCLLVLRVPPHDWRELHFTRLSNWELTTPCTRNCVRVGKHPREGNYRERKSVKGNRLMQAPDRSATTVVHHQPWLWLQKAPHISATHIDEMKNLNSCFNSDVDDHVER